MSDYMFMLENHLSTDQNRVIAEVEAAASVANFSLFLAGGAMRDMLGGFQIRDLDFVVEGNAPKLVKILTQKGGARVLAMDERRRTIELAKEGVASDQDRVQAESNLAAQKALVQSLKDQGWTVLKTSAKTGDGVEVAFNTLATEMAANE